ncbi:hypothetical protein ACFO9Q_18830 [Paenibacillus sp. GCM10023252]|uniref:hypothetical protein n=1 Tax=Paenibacillus sp. GCM10023252 TaxID=3252649 RepID=UPI0036225FB7
MANERAPWEPSLRTDPLKQRHFSDRLADQIRRRAAQLDQELQLGRHRRMRRWPLVAASLTVLILALAGPWLISELDHPSSQEDSSARQAVEVVFHPGLKAELTAMKPAVAEAAKILEKTVPVKLTAVQRPLNLRLYAELEKKNVIHAYLQDGKLLYPIGVVGSEGIDKVDVQSSDWTGDGEVQVTGSLASEPNHIHLVKYNAQTYRYELFDFQDHQVAQIDLDGDGREELVGNLVDSVPPYVELHRWNAERDYFEYAVLDESAALLYGVDRETSVTRSYLFQEGGQWIIEFGAGELIRYMTYKEGRLTDMKLKDQKSRLLEIQSKKQHMH